jgi:hypothetical protein
MVWSAGELTSADMNTYLPQAAATWTPTVTASSGTFTTVSGSGRYFAFGDAIVWSATITITTVGTAAGYIQFTLPATARDSTGGIGSGTTTVGGASLMSQVFLNSATVARVVRYDDSSLIGAGNVVRISGWYEAA